MSRPRSRSRRGFAQEPQPSDGRTAKTAFVSIVPAHMDYRAHIELKPVGALHESSVRLVRNADALTEAATRLIACSAACIPILAESDGTIVAGEEYWRAYRDLGHENVPVIVLDQLTKKQVRAFRLSFCRIGQMAVFDEMILGGELSTILLTPELIRMTPFSMPEIDQHLARAALLAAIPDETDGSPADDRVVVSQEGDL